MIDSFNGQDEVQLLKRVKIEKLADLETKIIGVVLVALAVGFLGKATDGGDFLGILQGGAGSSVVVCALCVSVEVFGE